MKRITLLTIALAVFTTGWVNLYGQAPAGFSYQSVVRDAAGSPLLSKSLQLKFTILQGSDVGTPVYSETQGISSNAQGLISATIGVGTPTIGIFANVDWANGPYFLKVEVDLNDGNGFALSGVTQLMSVPFALFSGKSGGSVWTNNQGMVYLTSPGNVGIGTTTPNSALEVKGTDSDPTVPLFDVKDINGNSVFAVYPDGVEVTVDMGVPVRSSNKGGFAVSGRNSTRALTDIFRVTPDSTVVFVNDVVGRSSSKGGFAVSGRNSTRTGPSSYFMVNPLTTKVATSSASEGFSISDNSANGETSYLKLLPKNYFIGYQTGNSIQKGEYNIFLGYQAGYNTTGFHGDMEPTDGDNNIFVGYQAGYANTVGEQNVYIGAFSGQGNDVGAENTFVGSYSGQKNTGYGNTFLGSQSGGSYQPNNGVRNTFIGCYSGQNNTTGGDNVFVGRESGVHNTTGSENVYIGQLAGLSNEVGTGNIFIGRAAGQNEMGSNKLIIANNANTSLVLGDFTAKKFTVNGDFLATTVGTISDQRLKKSITPIPNALAKVMSLRGVNFEWKDTSMNGKQIGFIAQEVEKVVPEVVNYSKEKDLYTLQYAPVTALLVEAMKEQQKNIEQLKAENDALKKQIEEIKQMVLQLKK